MKRAVCVLLAAVFLLCGLGLFTGCDESLLEPDESAVASAESERDEDDSNHLTAQDVPLARRLAELDAARRDNSLTLDLVQYKSKENLSIWAGKLHGALQEMTGAGALPADMPDKIGLYSGSEDADFTVMTDTLGCESVTCYFNADATTPYYTQLYAETQSGKAFEFGALLPFTYELTEPERDAMAQSFIQYMGLDVFTDWEKAAYTPAEGDLPSRDYSTYLVLYTSEAAGLRVSLEWHNDENGYLMLSYECSTEPYQLPGAE